VRKGRGMEGERGSAGGGAGGGGGGVRKKKKREKKRSRTSTSRDAEISLVWSSSERTYNSIVVVPFTN